MTISEARAAIETYRVAREYLYGLPTDTTSYENTVQLLYELGKYFICLESLVGDEDIIPTIETRILIAQWLLWRQDKHPNLHTLENLRVAVARMLDDNEFKVFMVKHEG